LILEHDVENCDPGQRGIEGGLEVLRRLHQSRGSSTTKPECDPEQKDRLEEPGLEPMPAGNVKNT
jgi:hypothetical protein